MQNNRLDRRDLGVAALFAVLVLGLFFRYATGNRTIGYSHIEDDLMTIEVAARRAQFDNLREGRYLDWNPYLNLGIPTASLPAMHPFYPGNFYFLPVGGAIVWTSLLHIFLAMLFAYILAREIGLSRVGSLISGLAYGLSGWLLILSFLHHQDSIIASAWIPITLFCVHRWYKRPGAGTWCVLAAVISLQTLGGGIQFFIIQSMACVLLLVLLTILHGEGKGIRHGAICVAGLFFACVVTIGINSISILATMAVMKDSIRVGGFSYEVLKQNSFPAPLMLLTMFLPMFQSRLIQAATPNGAYSLGAMVFIGAATLGLAICSMKSRNKMKWVYGLGFPVFGLLFASGVYNPLFVITQHLPVVNRIRSFVYFHSIFLIGAAIGAGLGVDAILNASPKARIKWLLLGVGIPVVLANGGIIAGAFFARGDLNGLGSFPILFGIVAIIEIALLIVAIGVRKRAVAIVFAAMIIVNFVGIRFGGIQPDPSLPQAGPIFNLTDMSSQGARIALFTPGSEVGASKAMNVALLQKKPIFSDFYRELPNRMAKFLNLLSPGYVKFDGEKAVTFSVYTLSGIDYYNRRSLKLLGMCAVSHIVTDGEEPAYANNSFGAGDMMKIGADSEMAIYENRFAMPRAYFVENVEFLPDEESVFERMADDSWSPADSVLLEESERPEPSPGATDAEATNMRAAFEPDLIRITVATQHGGALVVADAFAPGWTATDNGRPVPILLANGVLRGVLLGEGAHEIVMRYSDPAKKAGIPITVLSIFIILAALVAARFKSGNK